MDLTYSFLTTSILSTRLLLYCYARLWWALVDWCHSKCLWYDDV